MVPRCRMPSESNTGEPVWRTKRGRNDSIFERLDTTFSFEQALQHSIAVKGANTSRNAVHQMLKNWRKQGLIEAVQGNKYQKLQNV